MPMYIAGVGAQLMLAPLGKSDLETDLGMHQHFSGVQMLGLVMMNNQAALRFALDNTKALFSN